MLWAQNSLENIFFSQCCFVCQQVGEKALKALAHSNGVDQIKSHSLVKIAKKLNLNGEIEKAARKLDLYYTTTRCPDVLASGTPMDYYFEQEAKEAIAYAKIILDKVVDDIK